MYTNEIPDEATEEVTQEVKDEVTEILLNTREQCQMVEQFIRNQIEVKDRLIDKLHDELEYYKAESEDRFLDQIMKAIIKVRKDMKRNMLADDWEQLSADELRVKYSYIFEDLTDLLEQQNIDAFESAPGDQFDAKIHQAKVEITADEKLDKLVKQSVSEGYKKGEKTLIPERVIVYKFKQEQE